MVFLSTLVILFGYPFLFVIFCTCWIYKRWAVKMAQKDPKVGNILEGIDAVFAGHDPYNDPESVLMPLHSLAGKLDVPTVVKILKEKVIKPKLYPELTQRIVQKYGYYFWYAVDNFKVENHVRYIKPECPNMPITRTQLRDIVANQLGNLPFDSTKSPWEILVVPNMIDDRDPETKSVFILRVNHCLMDGYSIVNFTKKLAFKPWKMLAGEQLEEKQNKMNTLVEIYKFVMLLFTGPYHLLKMFAFSNDHHQFVQNTMKPEFEEIYNSQCTPLISAKRLKSVKNAYGVGMSSLLATLGSQATWKSVKRSGTPVSSTIHGIFSVPLPGHKDILSNQWSLVKIPIKINRNDPRKTLKFIENEFQSFRKCAKPLVFFYLNKLVALVPLRIRLNSKFFVPATFLLINFPGPTEPSDIFGCMLKHSNLSGKLPRGICKLFFGNHFE